MLFQRRTHRHKFFRDPLIENVREAGIKGDGIGKSTTAHSLRATMILLLLDAGDPESVVANRSGHRSVGILNHYSHFLGEKRKKVQYDLFCVAVKRNDDQESIRPTSKKCDSKEIETPKPIAKRSNVSNAQLSTLSALQIPSGSKVTIIIGVIAYNNSSL